MTSMVRKRLLLIPPFARPCLARNGTHEPDEVATALLILSQVLERIISMQITMRSIDWHPSAPVVGPHAEGAQVRRNAEQADEDEGCCLRRWWRKADATVSSRSCAGSSSGEASPEQPSSGCTRDGFASKLAAATLEVPSAGRLL